MSAPGALGWAVGLGELSGGWWMNLLGPVFEPRVPQGWDTGWHSSQPHTFPPGSCGRS